MNWLDVLFAAIVLAAFAHGVWKGFSRSAISLAATLLGLLLGFWFYRSAGSLLEPYLSSRALANFLGFFIVFFGIQLTGTLIAWIVAKIMKSAGLSWLDRLLGGAFGLLKASIICIAILMALMAFPFQPVTASVAGSSLAPYILGVANVLSALTPKELKDGFQDSYSRIQKALQPAPDNSSTQPREQSRD